MNVCLAELFSAYAPFTLRTAARFHGNGCQEGWLAVFFFVKLYTSRNVQVPNARHMRLSWCFIQDKKSMQYLRL